MTHVSANADTMARLSFMRASPHDVRPYLLLLIGGQDLVARDRCWGYGCRYLAAWAESRGLTPTPIAIKAAAWDGLQVLCMRRAQVPAHERARELGMRAATFLVLRREIVIVYRKRFHEACVAFKTGTIATLESLLWIHGPAKHEGHPMTESDTATPTPEVRSLAERMYPELAKPKADAAPPPGEPSPADTGHSAGLVPPAPEKAAEASEPVQITVDDLVNQELSQAERLYGDGSYAPDSAEGYDATLDEQFGQFERQARFDKNEEDAAALAEGRRQSAELLHELQVPREEARELSQRLSEWVTREPLSDDANWDRKVSTIAELEREWGAQTEARCALARRTAEEACARMPWLNDLLRAGAGNDPALIRRFAAIGLRQARRTAKAGAKVSANGAR